MVCIRAAMLTAWAQVTVPAGEKRRPPVPCISPSFRALSALSVENRVCDLRCGMLDGIGERKRAAAREPRGE